MTTSADCAARAAAQLREAARDVALVAERRTRRAVQHEATGNGAAGPAAGFCTPGCVPRDPAARDHRWPERWLLRTHLELAALDTAPGSARAHVRAVLREWHADADTAETAALIATELLTNAVESTWEHRRHDPVRLWVLGDGSSVLFLVWDATVRPPVLTVPASGDEHGRGLTLVNDLCEQWASLCVAYRYSSLAAQWWPVNGVDIDLQALPTQPGKAIQLELKTITPAGPGRHKVNVDLGQLWEYSRKRLARQPFYAFPRPHWDGELAAAARADGQDATELAVQRSKTRWWFGDWMVVMTTQQVADVLRQDLSAYNRRDRGESRCLVQFDISDPEKPVWGDPASSAPPSEVLGWSQFWSELDECGRDKWPQLIRVPRLVLGRRRKSRRRDEEDELYPRYELVEMFRQSEQLLAELQGRALEFETLEPDGNGNFRVATGYADNIAGSEPGDNNRASEPEDRRQVVFINSRRLFPPGR